MVRYHVRYTKRFTSGYLKGLTHEANVPFTSLEAATDHLNWCKQHSTKPVKPCVGKAEYTIHKPAIFADTETRTI